MHPEAAVHVHERAVRFVLLQIGAEAQYVAVGIFHLHFVRPRVIGGRMADFGAALAQFRSESFGVFRTDPSPRSGVPLMFSQRKRWQRSRETEANPASPQSCLKSRVFT